MELNKLKQVVKSGTNDLLKGEKIKRKILGTMATEILNFIKERRQNKQIRITVSTNAMHYKTENKSDEKFVYPPKKLLGEVKLSKSRILKISWIQKLPLNLTDIQQENTTITYHVC